MPICVVVLGQRAKANELIQKLEETSLPLRECQLVIPKHKEAIQQATKDNEDKLLGKINPVEIDKVRLLNPKIAKKSRQRSMAFWLMPFGFIAGLTFTQMTGLNTFSSLGLGFAPEALIGSLLGMGSGWIGSYVAASSVGSEQTEDINSLRKRNENGKWLLILETPLEIELPWQLIQQINPIEVVRLLE